MHWRTINTQKPIISCLNHSTMIVSLWLGTSICFLVMFGAWMVRINHLVFKKRDKKLTLYYSDRLWVPILYIVSVAREGQTRKEQEDFHLERGWVNRLFTLCQLSKLSHILELQMVILFLDKLVFHPLGYPSPTSSGSSVSIWHTLHWTTVWFL